MTDFRINNYELQQEAKRLAQECFDAGDTYGEDPNEYLWQSCEGHEWVIYTYKALLLCAECDTSEGEIFVNDFKAGSCEPDKQLTLAEHACAVAFGTLYLAAMDALTEIEDEARENV